MPELPEVETVRRGLEPAMVHARIEKLELHRPDLRFPFPPRFKARLEGQTITALGRRAKYLLVDLSSGEVLIMHLGMSGRFTIHDPNGKSGKLGNLYHDSERIGVHDHLIFRLSNGVSVTYNDPRRFGFMDLVPRAELQQSKHMKGIGVEPLGNALDSDLIRSLFEAKKAPLKAALLDQKNIAGLGNIYVCEALHRAHLSPKRKAATIATEKGAMKNAADDLATSIRDVLNAAVKAGGSSLKDFAQTDGSLGYFQHSFRVYDREGEPCPTPDCKGVIKRIVQSGRSTFFCPSCQK